MKYKQSKMLFMAVSAASAAQLALPVPALVATEATVTAVALPQESAVATSGASSTATSTVPATTTVTATATTTAPSPAVTGAKPSVAPIVSAATTKTPPNPAVQPARPAVVKPQRDPAPRTALASRPGAISARVGTVPLPVAPSSRPATLSSRSRDHDRERLLQQLQAQLQRSQRQLNQADADLSVGQKQLMSFGNTLRAAMMEAGPEAKGLHPFVKVAQRYAGTPYVWGGESGRGFDCSGFIIRVMRDLGYRSLPHSAAEQFNYGTPIAQALLKPGDLVFFANTYKPGISHVGIYLGRRRFIHAAGTGLGTIVSSLDTPKYRAKYAGARRLVAAHR